MKVSELIKKLSGVDGNAIVALSSDNEGNCYSILADIETGWVGDTNTPEDISIYDSEEACGEDLPKIVLLFPH